MKTRELRKIKKFYIVRYNDQGSLLASEDDIELYKQRGRVKIIRRATRKEIRNGSQLHSFVNSYGG